MHLKTSHCGSLEKKNIYGRTAIGVIFKKCLCQSLLSSIVVCNVMPSTYKVSKVNTFYSVRVILNSKLACEAGVKRGGKVERPAGEAHKGRGCLQGGYCFLHFVSYM